MSGDPMLPLLDVTKPFEVQTNALDFTLGGVLFQESHSIAYKNHILSKANKRSMIQKKEMLVVIHCLRVWHHYLLRLKFVGKTDNPIVSHFFTQSKLTIKWGCWQEFLQSLI